MTIQLHSMRLIILLIAIVCVSCSKKNDVCFKCSFGTSVNGNTLPDREVCTDGEDPDLGEVTDEQGNEYGWYCTKK